MLTEILDLLGYATVDELPYFGEQIILVFILVSLFFGALASFDAILKIIFSFLPRR